MENCISNFPIVCAGDNLPLGAFNVHSRFNKVINFVNKNSEIVFITSDENLLAANGIYLPGLNLKNISSLTISFDKIVLNHGSIQRSSMSIYDSSVSFDEVTELDFVTKLIQIPELFLSLFPEKSLVFLLNQANEIHFTSGFDRHFMLNALKCKELMLSGEMLKGVETIKGTGYGLTPSGDDFIAGLLFGMHYNEHKFKKNLTTLKNDIYQAVACKNLLTASFLYHAKQANYFKTLKKFLILFPEAELAAVKVALIQLLSVGATSGADLLTGYIFSIKYKIGI